MDADARHGVSVAANMGTGKANITFGAAGAGVGAGVSEHDPTPIHDVWVTTISSNQTTQTIQPTK